MGETETPRFFDFGTFGRVPGAQNQLFLFSDTPGNLVNRRKFPNRFSKVCLQLSNFSKATIFMFFGKTGAE